MYTNHDMEATQVPLNRRSNKEDGMNKNDILPYVTTEMGLEGIMPSEMRETEKDKFLITSLICWI